MMAQVLDSNLPNLTVLRRLHLVDEVLMSASAVLSVSSLSPEAETDSPQAEVAGDDTLTLYLGQVLTGHEYYNQPGQSITLGDWRNKKSLTL